jgi:hypothetical protein
LGVVEIATCNCQLGTFNLIRIKEMGVHTAGWAMLRRLMGRVSFSSRCENRRLRARGGGDGEGAELGDEAGVILMQDK